MAYDLKLFGAFGSFPQHPASINSHAERDAEYHNDDIQNKEINEQQPKIGIIVRYRQHLAKHVCKQDAKRNPEQEDEGREVPMAIPE